MVVSKDGCQELLLSVYMHATPFTKGWSLLFLLLKLAWSLAFLQLLEYGRNNTVLGSRSVKVSALSQGQPATVEEV